ncbi:Wzz/FepE/Etk N-terminal domain-containing protein [Mesorhizobium sp. M0136]|uniref:Wzz/FepE/Etk N-terminal domain-containing protein n=1 Tax=Mesorhizobium sp. M0136 TaxID=2956890 RepID=UPI00333CB2A9
MRHFDSPDTFPGQPCKDRDELTAKDILRFVRSSWRLCLLWMVVSLGVGGAYAVLSPRYYSAYATILLSSPPASQPGEAEADERVYVESQIQVIQSDEVIGRVVDDTGLAEDEEFVMDDSLRTRISSYVRGQLASLFGTKLPTAEPNIRHEAMVLVRRASSVHQLGSSSAVEIGVTSSDPLFSAMLANAIAGGYIGNQRERRQEARAEETSDLHKRLAELREKAFVTESLTEVPSDPESAERVRVLIREQQSAAEVYRSLYNALLQRAHSDFGASLIPSARVITAAEPPRRRSWPPTVLTVALSVMAGGVAGVGHALIKQAMNHRLIRVEDVRRSTGLDRIVGIPRIPRRRWNVVGPCEQSLQPVYSKDAPELHSSLSKIAARMRGVQGRQGGFVIGVASPLGKSGSSTVAVHLARIIAATGQKTLLVDANWQKPSMDQPMLNAEPGRKLARAFATIPADQERLEVLVLRPTGSIPDLNASLSISAALQHLQQEYSCIVVDFHSTDRTADLEVAMGVISEVLLVLKARRTFADHLEGILRIIPAEKLAAVILTRINRAGSSS